MFIGPPPHYRQIYYKQDDDNTMMISYILYNDPIVICADTAADYHRMAIDTISRCFSPILLLLIKDIIN